MPDELWPGVGFDHGFMNLLRQLVLCNPDCAGYALLAAHYPLSVSRLVALRALLGYNIRYSRRDDYLIWIR